MVWIATPAPGESCRPHTSPRPNATAPLLDSTHDRTKCGRLRMTERRFAQNDRQRKKIRHSDRVKMRNIKIEEL
jgi:hypothetical protein